LDAGERYVAYAQLGLESLNMSPEG
ncbi:hypothetical protein MGSAQ_003252, partial [marine sediment metagenome]